MRSGLFRSVRTLGVVILTFAVYFTPIRAQVSTEPGNASVAKFALVIGNSNYSGNRRKLKNPVNDSRLIAQNLRKLGFDVKQSTDLDRGRMITAVSEFADRLPEGATALVFYAGHGMQIGGASYLVPVDMIVTSEQSVPLRAYPLKTLLERLAASKSSVNIVVLDACRDNPFQPETPIRYRSFNNLGLAPVRAPVGTVVAYSTSPGQLAADGQDANSIYTAALAEVMLEPKLSIEAIFKRVGVQVRNKTQDDQIPWFESSLSDDYFLLPPDGATIVAGRTQPLDDARLGRKLKRREVGQSGYDLISDLWYLNLSESEWIHLDEEIQQRIQRMTGDDVPLLEHKATGGNVMAQTTLGRYWLTNSPLMTTSVAVDADQQDMPMKARAWLRKASNAGFAVAQTEVAHLYFDGAGVPRDVKEARRLLELAANANYPKAKRDLQTLDWE